MPLIATHHGPYYRTSPKLHATKQRARGTSSSSMTRRRTLHVCLAPCAAALRLARSPQPSQVPRCHQLALLTLRLFLQQQQQQQLPVRLRRRLLLVLLSRLRLLLPLLLLLLLLPLLLLLLLLPLLLL